VSFFIATAGSPFAWRRMRRLAAFALLSLLLSTAGAYYSSNTSSPWSGFKLKASVPACSTYFQLPIVGPTYLRGDSLVMMVRCSSYNQPNYCFVDVDVRRGWTSGVQPFYPDPWSLIETETDGISEIHLSYTWCRADYLGLRLLLVSGDSCKVWVKYKGIAYSSAITNIYTGGVADSALFAWDADQAVRSESASEADHSAWSDSCSATAYIGWGAGMTRHAAWAPTVGATSDTLKCDSVVWGDANFYDTLPGARCFLFPFDGWVHYEVWWSPDSSKSAVQTTIVRLNADTLLAPTASSAPTQPAFSSQASGECRVVAGQALRVFCMPGYGATTWRLKTSRKNLYFSCYYIRL